MKPLTPTVDTCTTDRPCSMARSRLMANCCSDSAVKPNVALLVWTARMLALAARLQRRVAHQPVVGHLEADRRDDPVGLLPRHRHLEAARRGRRWVKSLRDEVDLVAEVPEEAAVGDVLRERHGVLLDVALPASPPPGQVEQAGVGDVRRRALEHGADEQGRR